MDRKPVVLQSMGSQRVEYNRATELKSFIIIFGLESVHRLKRQPTECKKIFANHMPSKGLISKVYKELIQFKIKQPDLRMEKGPE